MLDRQAGRFRRFDPVAPLHDHCSLVEKLLETELAELGTGLDSVQVDVRDLDAAWVNTHKLKRRARDVRRGARPSRDATDEGRLAGPQVAFDKDQIPLPKPAAESFAGGLGLGRGVGDEVKQSGRSRSA